MNEFLTPRIVKADFTVLASAATQAVPSGVYLPKGAMVTGVTIFDVEALGSVHSNDSASFDLRAGAVALISTSCVSDMAARTIVYRGALVSSGGMYIPADGQVVLSVQESSGTLARTWSPTMYIGYIK